MRTWTLLTNHAHVLLCIARDPGTRLRDIAAHVGITERAVHRIVCDLEEAGYITRHRDGARNTYQLHPDLSLRAELEHEITVGNILNVLLTGPKRRSGAAPVPA